MANHTHVCGGTILAGGSGDQEHQYCDRCGAYTYDMDADVPDGTDEPANGAAWDAGDLGSPVAVTDTYPTAIATEIMARRPDLANDAGCTAIRAILTWDGTLTADDAIAIIDEATADAAAEATE